MEKILFVCDASSDVRPAEIEGKAIRVLPATICFSGMEKREFYDITPQEYWKVLEELDEVPVTQQVTPIHFLDCYKQAIAEGYTHVVAILISSTASGNVSSANAAKDLLFDEIDGKSLHIDIIDSRSYSKMYGQYILEGARQASEGVPCADIVRYIREALSRTEALFMVYTLKHLKKSGRISGMSAFVGETLGIRPILRCCDGVILPVDKARGEKNVIPRMIEIVKKYVLNPEGQVMQMICGDLPAEEIAKAEQLLRATFSPKDIIKTPLGCSIATNTGPHCMGVIYSGEKHGFEN